VLKLKNKILLAYAVDFVSFLIERIDINNIKKIILFGSVARDEASSESDIDLFIDIIGNKKSIETDIKRIKEEFLKSTRYQNYWLLKDIKNEIKPIIGKLDEWKELKTSIISDGIVLYGKFEEMPEKAVHKTLLSWENIKPESKRVMLSKRLFGYKKGKKSYEGLIQKYDGERIGKGLIAVPSANAKIFLKLFRDMNITAKIKKIIEYK
jgi:predicted nucleotidyltransferase